MEKPKNADEFYKEATDEIIRLTKERSSLIQSNASLYAELNLLVNNIFKGYQGMDFLMAKAALKESKDLIKSLAIPPKTSAKTSAR